MRKIGSCLFQRTFRLLAKKVQLQFNLTVSNTIAFGFYYEVQRLHTQSKFELCGSHRSGNAYFQNFVLPAKSLAVSLLQNLSNNIRIQLKCDLNETKYGSLRKCYCYFVEKLFQQRWKKAYNPFYGFVRSFSHIFSILQHYLKSELSERFELFYMFLQIF